LVISKVSYLHNKKALLLGLGVKNPGLTKDEDEMLTESSMASYIKILFPPFLEKPTA
jgi:hypothetical protein